jgi:transcriptional regulator with XRE-family HTH domain
MLNERIKSLRLAKGLTLQQVGDFFEISRASVASWESGTNQPDPRKLEKLAEIFDATVEYLVTGQSRGPSEFSGTQNTNVKFIPWEKLKDQNSNLQDDWVPTLYSKPSSKAFATRLVGSSSIDWISGPIPLGSIIIVEPTKSISQGCFVLAIDSSNELGIAEISNSKNDAIVLNFINKKSSISLKDKKRILGVLIEWRLSGKL